MKAILSLIPVALLSCGQEPVKEDPKPQTPVVVQVDTEGYIEREFETLNEAQAFFDGLKLGQCRSPEYIIQNDGKWTVYYWNKCNQYNRYNID